MARALIIMPEISRISVLEPHAPQSSDRATRETRFRRPVACALIAALLLGSAGGALAQEPDHQCTADTQVQLEVTVTDVHSDKGDIMLTVYPSDKDRWLKHRGHLFKLHVPAVKPATTACIALPKAGDYAVSIYHDENANHHFDLSWIGLPDEGYGFSRNAHSLFGPPSLDEALFHADAGKTLLQIKLRY